jgi:hypothetical protein
MRAQPVADHLFPSANGGLGPGSFRVPRRECPEIGGMATGAI